MPRVGCRSFKTLREAQDFLGDAAAGPSRPRAVRDPSPGLDSSLVGQKRAYEPEHTSGLLVVQQLPARRLAPGSASGRATPAQLPPQAPGKPDAAITGPCADSDEGGHVGRAVPARRPPARCTRRYLALPARPQSRTTSAHTRQAQVPTAPTAAARLGAAARVAGRGAALSPTMWSLRAPLR
jgi:hypothetical protein